MSQVRDLAECAWPAVLAASGSPFRPVSWCAWLAVVPDRCAGDLSRVRRLGLERPGGLWVTAKVQVDLA